MELGGGTQESHARRSDVVPEGGADSQADDERKGSLELGLGYFRCHRRKMDGFLDPNDENENLGF